jgi:hypothetical protein
VTTLDKPEVLAGLFAVWDDIDALLAGLSDRQWHARSPLPGWTVHDVTAHLIGTESMLQGVATPGADIDVSTLKHVRNDIGMLNERWVRKLRGVSATQLLEEFGVATAKRREALSGMSDDDWNQITATPAGPDTYARFMRVRDSTAGCIFMTFVTRSTGRPPTWTLAGRRPGWHSTRWPPAWGSSSASSAVHRTDRGWPLS